jgi:hypothetical protein
MAASHAFPQQLMLLMHSHSSTCLLHNALAHCAPPTRTPLPHPSPLTPFPSPYLQVCLEPPSQEPLEIVHGDVSFHGGDGQGVTMLQLDLGGAHATTLHSMQRTHTHTQGGRDSGREQREGEIQRERAKGGEGMGSRGQAWMGRQGGVQFGHGRHWEGLPMQHWQCRI